MDDAVPQLHYPPHRGGRSNGMNVERCVALLDGGIVADTTDAAAGHTVVSVVVSWSRSGEVLVSTIIE